MLEEQSILDKSDELNQGMRVFLNPVCKQTYESLPRIYGRMKNNLKRSIIKRHQKQRTIKNNRSGQCLSQDEDLEKVIRKTRNLTGIFRLSKPKNNCSCLKRNCPCNIHSDTNLTTAKVAKKKIFNHRPIILPQIKKFELEDLQSHYKVFTNRDGQSGKITPVSGLQRIIQEQQGVINNRLSKNHSEGKTAKLLKLAIIKPKSSSKPIIHSKFQIEEEQQIQLGNKKCNIQEGRQKKQSHQAKIKSSRFMTEVNDSDDTQKQKRSIRLSSSVFRRAKRENTNFHDLDVSHASSEKNRPYKKSSSIVNGLFRIPQQSQYSEYLQKYKPLNTKLSVRSMIEAPTFGIIRSEKNVYFGQINEQKQKHGTGISISDRQIYQGKYQKNIKVQGYERNLDGVYYGGFCNGVRLGFGIFKWNNGQVYQGNWEDGKKNGKGVWRSPTGDSYEGEWKNNRQHGKGVHKHKTSTYTGYFQNFLKTGHGEQKFVNGDIYIGQYRQGKPHGKGRYQWNEGGYFQGEFCRGFREGKGKWIDNQGTIYEGLFKRDFKHGFGKQYYTSGQRFEGQFIEGVRSRGKLYDSNQRQIDIQQQ